MNFSTIIQFFVKHKYSFIVVLISLCSLFIFPEVALAEGEANQEDIDKVVKILNGFITGAAALMGMVTAFITMFLYPGWVNGTLFGLQDYLKEIWILISNVVYFIFAFILIAIAFMNIIGKGEGTWELKQAMPKFIIGVLIVPFSWFFVQFILSVSAILTVGVLTLPHDAFSDKPLYNEALDKTELATEKICADMIISFNGEFEEGSTSLTEGTADDELDEYVKCAKDGTVTIKEILVGRADGSSTGLENSVFGVISIYSYGILKIDKLDSIFQKDLESIETIADLIFKIVFDILFIAVYLLLMIALLLALFVRGVRLWIYAMLSPVFGLLYFFGRGSEGFGESGKSFNIKEFIALALVPVYVSAALAFGLVFILVAGEGINKDNPEKDKLSAGGFSLTITGAHGDGESEKSVIGKLIVQIFGVVILWIAVMAALGASNTTRAIVDPIAQFGKSVGDLAAKAPTYAPIIPGPGGTMQSAASLKNVGSTLQSKMTTQQTDRASEFFGNSETAKTSKDLQNAATNLDRFSGDAKNTMITLKEALKGKDTQQLLGQKAYTKAALMKAASNLGLKDDVTKEFNFDSQQGIADVIARIDVELDKTGDSFIDKTFRGKGDLRYTELDSYLKEGTQPGTSKGDADAKAPPTTPTPPTTNNVNIKIEGTDVTNSSDAAKQYIAHKDKFRTDNAVEADLKAKGITDSTIISEVVAAYRKAVDIDGDGIADDTV